MRSLDGPDSRSDAALLSAHAAGDRDAFWLLFIRHRPTLRKLARRCSQTDQDADDAVQDAMLAAYHAVGRFRHEAAVGTWLQRIVINACRDRYRRNAFRTTAALPYPPVPDHSGHVEDRLVINEALLGLSVDQRAAVLVVDMHGKPVAEAARLLGVAEGTVKSRRSRARRRLTRQLRLQEAWVAHTDRRGNR